jgi:hypothetical protein
MLIIERVGRQDVMHNFRPYRLLAGVRRCPQKVLSSGIRAKVFQDSQAETEIFAHRPNSLDFMQIQPLFRT